MKRAIFAQVSAKSVHFPDEIRIRCDALDEQQRVTGESYTVGPFSWPQVIRRFWIPNHFVHERALLLQSTEDWVYLRDLNVHIDSS